jgi:hypothetical protein
VSDARQVRIAIQQEDILELITGRMSITNLPASAKLLSAWFETTGVWFDEKRLVLYLRLEDESFEAVPPGKTIPRMKLRARKNKR